MIFALVLVNKCIFWEYFDSNIQMVLLIDSLADISVWQILTGCSMQFFL